MIVSLACLLKSKTNRFLTLETSKLPACIHLATQGDTSFTFAKSRDKMVTTRLNLEAIRKPRMFRSVFLQETPYSSVAAADSSKVSPRR